MPENNADHQLCSTTPCILQEMEIVCAVEWLADRHTQRGSNRSLTCHASPSGFTHFFYPGAFHRPFVTSRLGNASATRPRMKQPDTLFNLGTITHASLVRPSMALTVTVVKGRVENQRLELLGPKWLSLLKPPALQRSELAKSCG
jgi:hypothetical protein